MRWIREHKVVAVLMLVLIVSFALLGVTLRYGQPGGTGILSRLYTTIEGPMIKAGSGIRENLTGFFAYQELMEENERLKAENAELRDEVNRLTLSANELQDLQDLAKALNYDFIKGENDIVTANVVSLDGTNWTNSFTIDKGTESAVSVGDPVMGENGLIGWISEADNYTAKVVTILSPQTSIGAIDKATGDAGIITGSAKYADDNLTMLSKLTSENKIEKGDIITSSGSSGIYPKGMVLGEVTEIGYDTYDTSRYAVVKPYDDISTVVNVAVISDFKGQGEILKKESGD